MDEGRWVRAPELAVPLAELAALGRVNPDRCLQPWIARACGVQAGDVLEYRIERRSLDARQRPRLRFLYRVVARIRDGVALAPAVEELAAPPASDDALWHLPLHPARPREAIVVGTGPGGLMAAYLLAIHGTRVLLLDRGKTVDERSADIARLHATRQLDPDSNYLFGEGGAGTFSDGKLYTRIKDRRIRFLLETFVAARAPRHILWHHHPHIGSDLLPPMCRRLRAMIVARGGEFRWRSTVVDIWEEGGRCRGVILESGERIAADATVLAIGHSARALIARLVERGLAHRAKGYQLGCRIEHPQELIDRAQYGAVAGRDYPRHLLSAAEYHLVSRPPPALQAASVTTFCMCPGGEIIPATSDPGQLSTNGMSCFARDSGFANAGLIVHQPAEPRAPLAALARLAQLERACFQAGGGDLSCPAQRARDFVRGELGPLPPRSSYRLGLRPARLDQLLPAATARAIAVALRYFERLIPGFLNEGTLIGIEARVSSPIRFERHPETLASSLPGLWLVGEGAGYAGGIVSAGIDGLRIAESILTGRAGERAAEPADACPDCVA
ncbi:MAG: NAD(P)/FAD-dependent oxidoreductase [Planctomycetota bacterium]|nr:NAD(P)/FAD-dependent oxidoreductase [Planctomycetota bacterium]MDW8372514.1 NAD(P)/FAD-dependent oxidoreductase [Planctomycetota bacterium]